MLGLTGLQWIALVRSPDWSCPVRGPSWATYTHTIQWWAPCSYPLIRILNHINWTTYTHSTHAVTLSLEYWTTSIGPHIHTRPMQLPSQQNVGPHQSTLWISTFDCTCLLCSIYSNKPGTYQRSVLDRLPIYNVHSIILWYAFHSSRLISSYKSSPFLPLAQFRTISCHN